MTQKSARWLVSKFFRQGFAKNFNLGVIDVGILRTIADFMDLSSDRICTASLSTLSSSCLISVRRLSPRLSHYVDLNLIIRIKKWKMYRYSLGDYFYSISQDETSDEEFVTGRNVRRSQDISSDDHRTKCLVTIENKEIENKEKERSAHSLINLSPTIRKGGVDFPASTFAKVYGPMLNGLKGVKSHG